MKPNENRSTTKSDQKRLNSRGGISDFDAVGESHRFDDPSRGSLITIILNCVLRRIWIPDPWEQRRPSSVQGMCEPIGGLSKGKGG